MIQATLSEEHTIELHMKIQPKWIAADPRVKENAGKIALMKGPCVYCLEEVEETLNKLPNE